MLSLIHVLTASLGRMVIRLVNNRSFYASKRIWLLSYETEAGTDHFLYFTGTVAVRFHRLKLRTSVPQGTRHQDGRTEGKL